MRSVLKYYIGKQALCQSSGEVSHVGKPNRQTVLLLAAGILAVVFSLGFFAGRSSVPYEVAAQTERAVRPTQEPENGAQAAAAETERTQAETEADAAVSYPIDLNTATLEELMTLPRIGEKLAQRILDYRAAYGRFSAPEQLMDVDGIGEATFDGLKELVKVEDPK